MNRNIVKNFAVWARKSLIKEITDRLLLIGITRDEIKIGKRYKNNYEDFPIGNGQTYRIYGEDIEKRDKLVKKIKERGFDSIVEEAAYTWFNRVIAVRFMEINNYLPSGIRVLSSLTRGKVEPDIITYFDEIDFNIDYDYAISLKRENKTDELFRYLFIEQCNSLNEILPGIFKKTNDYRNLLFPVNLSNKNSFIRKIVSDIDESYFFNNVEIIGWLYQYYITEKKDEIFKLLKQNVKISKENIPSVTQIFTPKWIVKYMVENSLGRFYMENNNLENFPTHLKYFVDSRVCEGDFKGISPEEIKIIDPCMGSGHILVYAFDILFEIYKEYGYLESEIPYLIFENNLFGIDVDDRAYELAYFALMMKGRSKYRRFFNNKDIKFNLYPIIESNDIYEEVLNKAVMLNDNEIQDLKYLLDSFKDAKEYGSLLSIRRVDFNRIKDKLYILLNDEEKEYLDKITNLSGLLSDKYHIVITNPPYMSSRGMGEKLTLYLKERYPNSKMDLFSVFIERGFELTCDNGFNVMLTMQSWMFLYKFEKLRKSIFENNTIISLLHMDNNVMSIAFGTSATIFKKKFMEDYEGIYNYVKYEDLNAMGEPSIFPISHNRNSKIKLKSFYDVPGFPLNYWISDRAREVFRNFKPLKEYFEPKQGMATTDNKTFIRYWYELNKDDIEFYSKSHDDIIHVDKRWFPYNKGGDYRKWYGNNEYIIKYENAGEDLINFVREKYPRISDPEFVIKNRKYYFKKGITWSLFGFKNFGVRYKDYGFIFDVSGSSLFPDDKYEKYILAFLCSNVCFYLLSSIAPTVNFQIGNIGDLPIIINDYYLEEINRLANRNIYLCKKEWDFYETSWDFKTHPAIEFKVGGRIKDAYYNFHKEVNIMFNEVKENEERINEIFKEIYEFTDEVSERVEDGNVSIRSINEKKFVESFISYFVGCVFGRYSLDYEKVVNNSDDIFNREYRTFYPQKDNLIIISTEDYFENDIYRLFVKFLKVVFGDEFLDENLRFICNSLSYKVGSYRENIIQYFLRDFSKYHMRTYNKCPIYLEFCSGKNNGINALTYVHRLRQEDFLNFALNYIDIIEHKYEEEILRFENVYENERFLKSKRYKEILILKLEECKKYNETIKYISNIPLNINLEDGIANIYKKLQDIGPNMSDNIFK